MDEALKHIQKVQRILPLQFNQNTFQPSKRQKKNSKRPVVEYYDLGDSDQENMDPNIQSECENAPEVIFECPNR